MKDGLPLKSLLSAFSILFFHYNAGIIHFCEGKVYINSTQDTLYTLLLKLFIWLVKSVPHKSLHYMNKNHELK